jgi:hypothetical protein
VLFNILVYVKTTDRESKYRDNKDENNQAYKKRLRNQKIASRDILMSRKTNLPASALQTKTQSS